MSRSKLCKLEEYFFPIPHSTNFSNPIRKYRRYLATPYHAHCPQQYANTTSKQYLLFTSLNLKIMEAPSVTLIRYIVISFIKVFSHVHAVEVMGNRGGYGRSFRCFLTCYHDLPCDLFKLAWRPFLAYTCIVVCSTIHDKRPAKVLGHCHDSRSFDQ